MADKATKANCAKCEKPQPAKQHPVMKHMLIVNCPEDGVTHAAKKTK